MGPVSTCQPEAEYWAASSRLAGQRPIGFRVSGLGFKVSGLGSKLGVEGLGCSILNTETSETSG